MEDFHDPETLFSSYQRWDTFDNAQVVDDGGAISQGTLHSPPDATTSQASRVGMAEAGRGPRQLGCDTLGFLPLAE
jgi:hypothetical protein